MVIVQSNTNQKLERQCNYIRSLGAALGLALLFGTCSGGADSPSGAVVDLLKAINEDDTSTVVALVDFDQVATGMEDDIPSLRAADSILTRGAIVRESLLGEGALRQRWIRMQAVVNKVELSGDTALVEVSFVDRVTGVQYYNKWKLIYRPADNIWRVIAFRTM